MLPILKSVAAIVASALGVLFGIGFLLAWLFELQGFGDRDSTPSGWRLLEYGVGFVACVAVPAALWGTLGFGSGRARLVAFGLAAITIVVILGVSLRA